MKSVGTTTSFDKFAENYDKAMGDTGDITHQKTIDPALFKAIGSFKDKLIYDIGCGNGYLARRFARNGGKKIWASDISKKLIEIAQEKYENPNNKIKYLVREASDFSGIPANYFDLVVMNMVIHYINPNKLDRFFKSVSKSLVHGGRFVFTTGHPLFQLARLDAKGWKNQTPAGLLKSIRGYTSVRKKIEYNPWTGKKDLTIFPAPLGFYINKMSRHKLLVDVLIEPETIVAMDDISDPTPASSPIPLFCALGAKKVK